MGQRRRVVALGLDAVSYPLVREWAAAGDLPNLAALMRRGISGRHRGLDGFFVGSTWPSLYTGRSPAGHGHHSLVQLPPGSYAYRRMAEGPLVQAAPFWRALSAAGRRVAILDVPLSELEPGLNGIQTVEWGSHDAVYGFRAQPAALQDEIRHRHGTHPLGPVCDGAHRGLAEYRELLERLLAGVRAKARLTRELLAREPWDLFMQVFTEAHCAGHQCWHLHDPAHPAHDPAVAGAIGDPLRRVYAEIDRALGDILGDLDDTATVAVFSGHDMSFWYGAQWLLPEILFRLGVAAPPPAPMPRMRERALDVAAAGWSILPPAVRQALRPVRDRVAGAAAGSTGPPELGVDPARSRCFPVINGQPVGGIRLNLRGREPDGQLEPGAPADAFCAELTRALLAIVDERTGASAVRRVVRTAELYDGPCIAMLPDLLVEWRDALPTGSMVVSDGADAAVRLRSPELGMIQGQNRYGRTGEHRPDGFAIFAGPGIRPGALPANASLLDLAPTLAALCDATLPHAEGRVLPGVVA